MKALFGLAITLMILAFGLVGFNELVNHVHDTTKTELATYNKEHGTNYKKASDVKETVTYHGTFTIKTVEDDKDISDYVFGNNPSHKEITYTTDKGSKITTTYTGDLDDGTYKDGTVTITTNPIYGTKTLTASE